MIVNYPTDASLSYELPEGTTPQKAAERAGETHWYCDVAACKATAKIETGLKLDACPSCGAKKPTGAFCARCGAKLVRSVVPKGWRTSDPDNDPHVGGAQFCPKHAKNIYVPEVDDPASLVDNPRSVA